MIITEIRKDYDERSLDQLVELMMHLYEIDLIEACNLLENVVAGCQLTIGAFEKGQLIGVIFGRAITSKEWLVSPLFSLMNDPSTLKIGDRLVRFIENEIRYYGGKRMTMLLETTDFFERFKKSSQIKTKER